MQKQHLSISILLFIFILSTLLLFFIRSNSRYAIGTFPDFISTINSNHRTSLLQGIRPVVTKKWCTAKPDWIYRMHGLTNQKGPRSQGAQDLYLEEIYSVIETTNKYFVEFGFNEQAYDAGGSGANTWNLYVKGWRGLLLDGGRENKKINLKKHYLFANNIASIFQENNVPKELDFLSCDMDSYDLWVLRAILQAGYRPRVMTTEFNANYPITDALTLIDPSIASHGSVPKNFSFVFAACAWGASAKALRILIEPYGYTMVGRVSLLDLVWIRTDQLHKCFRIPPFEWFFTAIQNGKQVHKPVSNPTVLSQIVDYETYVRTADVNTSNQAARSILKKRKLPCFRHIREYL